jgi:hypothetical protein
MRVVGSELAVDDVSAIHVYMARDSPPIDRSPPPMVRQMNSHPAPRSLTTGRWRQHYRPMRMTVTLDPDIAERIEQEVRRAGKPAEAVVNDALRTRLGLKGRTGAPEPFRVEPHDFRFAAGLDLDKMNQLADALEAAAAAQKVRE